MRRWIKQLKGERDSITPNAKAITPEHRRIQELEARIKQRNRADPERVRLRQKATTIHKDSRGSAEARTIAGQLTQDREAVGRYKAASLMDEAGLLSVSNPINVST